MIEISNLEGNFGYLGCGVTRAHYSFTFESGDYTIYRTYNGGTAYSFNVSGNAYASSNVYVSSTLDVLIEIEVAGDPSTRTEVFNSTFSRFHPLSIHNVQVEMVDDNSKVSFEVAGTDGPVEVRLVVGDEEYTSDSESSPFDIYVPISDASYGNIYASLPGESDCYASKSVSLLEESEAPYAWVSIYGFDVDYSSSQIYFEYEWEALGVHDFRFEIVDDQGNELFVQDTSVGHEDYVDYEYESEYIDIDDLTLLGGRVISYNAYLNGNLQESGSQTVDKYITGVTVEQNLFRTEDGDICGGFRLLDNDGDYISNSSVLIYGDSPTYTSRHVDALGYKFISEAFPSFEDGSEVIFRLVQWGTWFYSSVTVDLESITDIDVPVSLELEASSNVCEDSTYGPVEVNATWGSNFTSDGLLRLTRNDGGYGTYQLYVKNNETSEGVLKFAGFDAELILSLYGDEIVFDIGDVVNEPLGFHGQVSIEATQEESTFVCGDIVYEGDGGLPIGSSNVSLNISGGVAPYTYYIQYNDYYNYPTYYGSIDGTLEEDGVVELNNIAPNYNTSSHHKSYLDSQYSVQVVDSEGCWYYETFNVDYSYNFDFVGNYNHSTKELMYDVTVNTGSVSIKLEDTNTGEEIDLGVHSSDIVGYEYTPIPSTYTLTVASVGDEDCVSVYSYDVAAPTQIETCNQQLLEAQKEILDLKGQIEELTNENNEMGASLEQIALIESRLDAVEARADQAGRIVESNNFALGEGTLENADSTTDYNFAFGRNTLHHLEGGDKNISIGNRSQYNNVTGNDNISIGNGALDNVVDGEGNIAIGKNAGNWGGNSSNKLSIGTGAPLIGGDFETREITLDGKTLSFLTTGTGIQFVSWDQK